MGELADLEPLTSVKSLTMLSLLHNPVVTRRNYREYVIHKFPNLRVLDFKKVKDGEGGSQEAIQDQRGKDTVEGHLEEGEDLHSWGCVARGHQQDHQLCRPDT